MQFLSSRSLINLKQEKPLYFHMHMYSVSRVLYECKIAEIEKLVSTGHTGCPNSVNINLSILMKMP